MFCNGKQSRRFVKGGDESGAQVEVGHGDDLSLVL
jgi:hypothetical protein